VHRAALDRRHAAAILTAALDHTENESTATAESAQRLDLRGVRFIYQSLWRPLLRGGVVRLHPSERLFHFAEDPNRVGNQIRRTIAFEPRDQLSLTFNTSAWSRIFVLPISTDVWASAVGFGISYKRLLNPKVLVNEANARSEQRCRAPQ